MTILGVGNRGVWTAIAALCVIGASACNVTPRSDAFRCESQSECPSGRVCSGGFCVLDDPNAPDGAPMSDAGPDARVLVCTDWSFDPVFFDACSIPLPSGALTLNEGGTYQYDTSDGELRDPDDDEVDHSSVVIGGVRIVSVVSLSLGIAADLEVDGSMPLLIASWSTATLDGDIEVQNGEAGADPSSCPDLSAPQENEGGGGGGGGGFGASGGGGGSGGAGSGAGGNSGPVAAADTLRGGCPGGRGGQADQGPSSGTGGSGGGVVFFTALESIDMGGTATAPGEGGEASDGSSRRNGGGGGGSGGLLGFEAPTVTFATGGIVAANGGGGGGGTNNQSGNPGTDGLLGDSAAPGGSGEQGGDGSPGGAQSPGTGVSGSPGSRGGGGGGGGVGHVLVYSTTPNLGTAVLSPSATIRPLQ